jgi:enediyne biosynthesis protein E4
VSLNDAPSINSGSNIVPSLPPETWPLVRRGLALFHALDPRIPVAAILMIYLVLGLTLLGFDRSWSQIFTTTALCCGLEMGFCYAFHRTWRWPLSALITSLSLSFLLNYSYGSWMILLPPLIAIGSKYVLRWNGKHFFNPALTAVTISLLISHSLITSAPAYQWNGIASLWIFIALLGVFFVGLKVPRTTLILAFLMTYTVQTALRALIMRHHLPFETLFLGTLTSPSFMIFVFFMITDPQTSPKDSRTQMIVGIAIALCDLAYHLVQSYYTFFFAAFTVAGTRFVWFHFKRLRQQGVIETFKTNFIASGYWRMPLVVGTLAAALALFYDQAIYAKVVAPKLDFKFVKVAPEISGFNYDAAGDLVEKVDPRVQHIAKWLLAETESIAVADVDGDGRQDVFVTQPMKAADGRALLFLNRGDYQFEKVEIPALKEVVLDPGKFGLISQAIFIDYDNDGDQDIYLSVVHGHPILLQNQLKETGRLEFKDVSRAVGLADLYTQSIAATFADFNRDGRLDLFIGNALEENLPDYDPAEKFNLFHLPPTTGPDDHRPFNFMHASWNNADNGGKNIMLFQNESNEFVRQDPKLWGGEETRWSLAVSSASLKNDGYPDLYIANDFGPDEIYLNRDGKYFEKIKDKSFGGIGNDTYKGMNASIADLDRTGWFSVYISNVHHALQAEGSLLWSFSKGDDPKYPKATELATKRGILNEERFGWAAVATDFDNDGWIDVAQANGMVDDRYDKKTEKCGDYWYINEKIARSAPEYHRHADKWGDIRGYCIYGTEQNRVYLNRGPDQHPQFFDVATELGVTEMGNSRAAVSADFENRGRRDLMFNHPFAQQTLYKNEAIPREGHQENQWLGLTLEGNGTTCNRDAIGTRVDVTVEAHDGSTFHIASEVQTVSGLLSQSDRRLHFGLGPDPQKITALISWCGAPAVALNLESNRYNHVVQK